MQIWFSADIVNMQVVVVIQYMYT